MPKLKTEAPETKPFNPFCNIDGVQLSIHCHINAVRSLLCAPGLVPRDLGKPPRHGPSWIIVLVVFSYTIARLHCERGMHFLQLFTNLLVVC